MAKNTKPTIRFKGFTDDWEQRKLGEVVEDFIERSTYENQYPVLTSSQQKGIVFQDEYFSGERVSQNGNIGYFVIPRGYFTYRSRSDNDVFVFNRNDIVDKGIISYFYPVFKPKNVDSDFFLRRLNYGIDKQVKLNSEGTGQHVLSLKKFKNIVALFPSKTEQQLIGKFFANLDSLITLHQRKYDSLVNVKKAMFEKMFPKNGETVPEIRFKGFTDTWEQREFDDFFEYIPHNSLSRDNLNYDEGEVKNIHYGDVLIKFGEVLNPTIEKIPFVNKDIKFDDKSCFLQDGDIVIADAAEDLTVGKCTEISNGCNQKLVAGLHTIPCRPKNKIEEGFLGFYLNSKAYHNQLLPLIQGTKVSSISKSSLKETWVTFPFSSNEQKKIGSFFLTLNNLITLHQRRLEKLKNIKKSCLEKMFV